MAFTHILQYKAGQLLDPGIITGNDEPSIGPIAQISDPIQIGENGIITMLPNSIAEVEPPTAVGETGDIITNFGANIPDVSNPTVDSTSTATGGSSDEDAWWITSYGSTNCVDNEIQVFFSITWLTPAQDSWGRINLGEGDPC